MIDPSVAYPRTASIRVEGPVLADNPDDGGKWAIYCAHLDAAGETIYASVLQDTNRRRVSAFRAVPVEWCGLCQEEARGGSNWTLHHPYADVDPTHPPTNVGDTDLHATA